jgi:hypothetical protein
MPKKNGYQKTSHYDDDGVKKKSRTDVKKETEHKRQRNLENALKSRNIARLEDYEDQL